MLRNILLILFTQLVFSGSAQFMHTNSLDVRSPMMELNGEWGALPVMKLGSDDVLLFSFDEMSHIYRRFTYRITHCDADWNPSDISEIDYLEGFNGMPIEEWENSVNTTRLYTHYSFTLPNENVSLLLSGNYKVEIYDEESDDEEPVLVYGFSVVEPRISIDASVSGDTDASLNDGQQQLSFVLNYGSYSIPSPATEIIPVVYQNRRRDNAVRGIKPTYMTGTSLEYVHNSSLIFNAGNEYRRFELTDPRTAGMNVEEIALYGDEYHALLYMDKQRRSHSNYIDENGRFYVNTHEGYGSPIEADYAYVHFALDVPYREGGDYYLLGDLCNNLLTPLNRLDYDEEGGYYHTTQLLKLGLYNYMYVWVPSGGAEVVTYPVEGDFYNTENEYVIYVYYREFGARYDKLIGVSSVNYKLEYN